MDPLLHRAATYGETSFLETLTGDEETRYFSQLTPKNNTLLHVAAEFKQAEFFKKVCLKCNPPLIWQRNSNDETPLHVAARAGCLEIVRFLIQRASVYVDGESRQHYLIRKKNNDGDTALHCAVRNGHYYVVEFLLETDPELSSFCNCYGESPLYIAAANSSTDIVILILGFSSSSFSHSGPNGLTPLHEVVCKSKDGSSGLQAILEELVRKRPEMVKEADDIIGWTPLHFAAFYGAVEGVKLLLKYDVGSSSAYLLDHDGNSALHLAALGGHLNVIKALLQSYPDIFELTNKKKQTALHVAVLNGNAQVVEYVLGNPQLGWLLNEPDGDGNTPLHLAVLFDYDKIIELLLANKDKGVHVNALNKDLKAASDIFFLHFRKPGYKTMKIKSLFKERSLARSAQQIYTAVGKEWMNRTPELKPFLLGFKEDRERAKKSYTNFPVVFLVLATIILTISFSAAITLPGGTEKGEPVLADKLAFKAFLTLDTVAFICSFVAVIFQQFTATSEYLQARYHKIQARMLLTAIIALAFAFASGVHATLAESAPLVGLTIYVIVSFVIATFWAIWFVDPFGGRGKVQMHWKFGKYHFQFLYGGSAGMLPSLSIYARR